MTEAARLVLQRAERPDILHSHMAWPDLGARLFRRAHPVVPLVSSIYGICTHRRRPWLRRTALNMAERATRSQVAAFVFNSQAARACLGPRHLPTSRCHLIPPGVDAVQCFPMSMSNRTKYRDLLGVPEDCPLLISAGRFEPVGGHIDLIDAMPLIQAVLPDARLFLIGDGPERPNLEARIAALALGGSVRLVGTLGKMLPNVFSCADLAIEPAREATFVLSVAEALATGTPVVATRVGGLPEIIRDGESGMLIEPRQPEAIAAAVLELLSNEERYLQMGDAARADMLERFEIGHTTTQYIKLWKTLNPDALWQSTDSVPAEEFNEEEIEAYLEKDQKS